MPYWLQPDLCKPYQQIWWEQSIAYLFPSTSLATSLSKDKEKTLNLNPIIGLVRLKSNVIKLGAVDAKKSDSRSKFEQFKTKSHCYIETNSLLAIPL